MNALSSVQAGQSLESTTALTAQEPDADLIAACAMFDRLERAWLATDFSHDDETPEHQVAEAERDRIRDAQDPVLDRITAEPPVTIAGVVALARTIMQENPELLKEDYGTCPHDWMLVTLLNGLTKLPPTQQPITDDLALVKAASEFCRVFDSLDALNFDAAPGSPEEDRVFVAQKEHVATLCGWAELMGHMQATTDSGLAARARVLGRNDADKHFSYDENGALSDMLLRPLLRDAHALALGQPVFNPDADLLALRPTFDLALAEYNRVEAQDVTDEEMSAAGEAFDDICRDILALPPAVSRRGRALQAIATIYTLKTVSDWEEGQETLGAVGMVRKHMVAQVDGEFPIPGTGIHSRACESPADADAPLLALKPEIEALQSELDAAREKSPRRRGKGATQRRFDVLMSMAMRMPKARTAAGVEFQQRARDLALARGLDIIRATRA